MKNPFPTEADWNEFVKKYDIPAKITKAHAKKVIGLRKAFGKAGLESGAASTIPSASAKAAKNGARSRTVTLSPVVERGSN